MENTRLLRKKALAELSKVQTTGRVGRGSVFGPASNTPAPGQYAEKAATQELRQKPNYTRSEYVVDMGRQAGTRFQFLLSKLPSDYNLGYHQYIQQDRTRSSLKERPVLKLGREVERDKVSHMKKEAAIMNE